MSAAPAIEYWAPPTLGRFMGSQARVRLVVGPVGSGKSSGCIVELLRRALETPPGRDGVRRSRWVVIRNTYRELEDTTIKTAGQWIPEALGRWRKASNTFQIDCKLPGWGRVEAEILFRALDRPDHVGKLLSLELTGAYINEAKEIPRGVWDMVQVRVGRYPSMKDLPDELPDVPGCRAGTKYWTGLWADTNPPDTDHYLYRIFEEEKPEGFELFRQPGGRDRMAENHGLWKDADGQVLRDARGNVVGFYEWDRPRGAVRWARHLKPGYYEEAASGKPADWVKVYIDGEYGFVKEGKPMWPEYNDQLHCVPVKPLPGQAVRLGMDFGLTPAAVLGQRDPSDGQLQIFAELVAEDLGAVTFARELARQLRAEHAGRQVMGWGDPAGEQRSQVDERTPFDVVRGQGLPVLPAPTNDFTLRREAVAGLLSRLTIKGRPALVVDPACTVLRKALAGGYCLQRLAVAGDERFRDAPVKNHFSHVADALQYLCVGEGEDRRAVQGTAPRRPPNVIRSFGSSR